MTGTGRLTDGDPGLRIPPAIAPAPGEVIVTKRRVSAFAGSDLDVVLRAGGTTSLVLAGIATSGLVLSTLRQAADLDHRLTGLVDEVVLHVAPKLVGRGVRLFDSARVDLRCAETIQGEGAVHLRYGVR
ncbi:MAG: isochorismatase family protein [Streptosporangiaceae bacterium]